MLSRLAAFLLAFLFTHHISASTHATRLSDQAEVKVIILDPTQTELYSAFGHSAFRVSDPTNRIDIVFNYGIFDFDQPNFYLNFTKGKLYYKLGTGDYEAYKNYYFRTDRTFREHLLQISQEEKQKVFDFLMDNAKPENSSYYYNYCYDNCASRMRDVLQITLGDRIAYKFDYASDSLSFRGLMDRYLGQQPWGDFGIDVCLGSEIDRTATGWQYMYMPEYLEAALLSATFTTDSLSYPLIAETKTINVSSESEATSTFKPIHLFILLFFVVGLITHRGLKYQTAYRFIDVVLFGLTGALGVFLLFLWFGTDHLSKYNFNLIWAMPLNLAGLYFLIKKKQIDFTRYYFFGFGLLQILLLIFREMLPQQIHYALIPFVLALALRSFYLVFELKGERKK